MKRILLSTDKIKVIIELYLVHNEAEFAKNNDGTFNTTDGKEPDINIYIDCDGAHIMIPNMDVVKYAIAL